MVFTQPLYNPNITSSQCGVDVDFAKKIFATLLETI